MPELVKLINSKSEVRLRIRAFTTTDTLKPLMKTEMMGMEFHTHFHVLKLKLCELSGSQCISGFQALTRFLTSEFGFNTHASAILLLMAETPQL